MDFSVSLKIRFHHIDSSSEYVTAILCRFLKEQRSKPIALDCLLIPSGTHLRLATEVASKRELKWKIPKDKRRLRRI